MAAWPDDDHHPLAERFRAFIRDSAFSCVGAKSALARDQIKIVVARNITSAWDDLRILPELHDFAARYRENRRPFQSFVVLFEGPETLTEDAFEQHLWTRVQSLSDKDDWLGQVYDHRVSPDPENPHFSLSFGGEAFFVVGLHPGASRLARRFERPALVFILDRDHRLNGSQNPMLARFGESSEARQYSGRIVEQNWRCPFNGRSNGGHGRQEYPQAASDADAADHAA